MGQRFSLETAPKINFKTSQHLMTFILCWQITGTLTWMQKDSMVIWFQNSASDVVTTKYFKPSLKAVCPHNLWFLQTRRHCVYRYAGISGMSLNCCPFLFPQFISFDLPTDSLWQLFNKFYLLVLRGGRS